MSDPINAMYKDFIDGLIGKPIVPDTLPGVDKFTIRVFDDPKGRHMTIWCAEGLTADARRQWFGDLFPLIHDMSGGKRFVCPVEFLEDGEATITLKLYGQAIKADM